MLNLDFLGQTVQLIKKHIRLSKDPLAIEAVRVGIFFTGVKLNSGHAGVAFTSAKEIPEAVCCPRSAARMPEAGKLAQKPIGEVLNFTSSRNVLKTAIGVALTNALSQYLFETGITQNYEVYRGKDGLDFLDISSEDRICLVGAFTPYIRRFKKQQNPFFIIEKTPEPLREDERQFFRPSSEAPKILSDSDVVIITGATIVNHTLDKLLKQTKHDSKVAIIGPTASMIPNVYFNGGVDLMAGVQITNSDQMLRVLEEGGSGYHLYNTCAEKVTFVKSRPL